MLLSVNPQVLSKAGLRLDGDPNLKRKALRKRKKFVQEKRFKIFEIELEPNPSAFPPGKRKKDKAPWQEFSLSKSPISNFYLIKFS